MYGRELKIRYHLLVKPFGLNTGKREVPILYREENEIVIGENDKHLYYRVSILNKRTEELSEIYLTTIVKFNNNWGKVYFTVIKPFHKLVVKSMLKKYENHDIRYPAADRAALGRPDYGVPPTAQSQETLCQTEKRQANPMHS